MGGSSRKQVAEFLLPIWGFSSRILKGYVASPF
jgi:hypothetical protein